MPPTALTLHILLALAVRDQAPLEIWDQVVKDVQGSMVINESSFYKALHRLEREGLIEAVGMDGRRRLAGRGSLVLKRERVRIMRAAMLLRSRV